MKYIKKINEMSELILTDKEKRKIWIKRGKCPVCQSNLIENVYGEDEVVYRECSENDEHYSKRLGLYDDLNE